MFELLRRYPLGMVVSLLGHIALAVFLVFIDG